MRGRTKQKTRASYDFIRGGFPFRVTDEDALYWDTVIAKSIIKYTKRAFERAIMFKGDYEQDYDRREYDCTGSTQVRIKVKRRRSHIIINYRESKDV